MNYLIDTHILLWSLFEPSKIKSSIQEILKDRNNTIYVSKISFWEISLKYSLGKIEIEGLYPEEIEKGTLKLGYEIKDIETNEVLSYYKLAKIKDHKDPFDRMLIWQSIKNKYILISRDSSFENYKDIGLKSIY